MENSSNRSKPRDRDQDRLSELPDSLIFNIFEFLPMNDVVRTQILSHRWKNLWITTPYLHFDGKSAANCDQFRHFVARALFCWRGKKIQKFKLSSLTFSDKSLTKDMSLWVRFAVDYGVEELEAASSFKFIGNQYKDNYHVPNCLYSCSSLQKLSFIGDINGINENVVQWNQLKCLKIVCFRVTQDAIDLVLSRNPMLEVFTLISVQEDNNSSLSFRSNSLKELSVHMRIKDKRSPDDISKDMELRIWTPNLETLAISGGTYGKCILMSVSSLIHANLSFSSKVDNVRETLRQIIPTMQHVKGLTLSNSFTPVLGFEACKGLLPPSMSVVFLSLYGSFEEHIHIVGLLEIFPKLKKLVIVDQESKSVDPNRKNFKPNPSKSFLVELRTADITWNMRDFSIFPLVEIMLRCASKLEKMVFRVKRTVPPSELLLTSQTKLLRMPRSSPNAELIFCEI